MTDKLLSGIKRQQIPVVGFVNESLLYVRGETDARIGLLKAWSDAGVELGNHTFAHVGFKDTPLAEYEDDFVRGETVTKAILKQRGRKPRFFLHPFLQMGAANELNADNFDALVGVIRNRGYQFVTLERAPQDPVYKFPDKYQPTSDWLRQWSLSDGKKFEAPQPPEFIQKIYEDDQNGRSPGN
jgi:peptidoglycan/xylan/chitin deacetylase (PgdA/CDA1 family)